MLAFSHDSFRSPDADAGGGQAAESGGTCAEWVFDIDRAVMLDANPAALALWEAPSRDALLARSFSDLSDAARLRLAGLAERLARGEEITDLWTFYPGGHPKTVRCVCRAAPLTDGRIAMRVTAAPSAPDAERGLENLRWIEAFRHAPNPVTVYALSGACLLQNPAAWRVLGPDATLLGHVVDRDQAERARAMLHDGHATVITARVLTTAGPRWHDLHMRTVQDPGSGERVALVQEIDVTGQRVAADRLQASEALLSGVLETAMDGVLAFRSVRDEGGAIVDFECLLANAAALRMAGTPDAGLAGRRLSAIVAPQDAQRFVDACRDLVETGFPLDGEICQPVGRERRWFKIVAVTLGDGFTATVCDVTAERALEAALRGAKEDAEAASRAKSEFLAAASHELRTPMHGVLGALDLLREAGIGGEVSTILSAARRSAGTLMDLIDSLLEFAALDTPRAGEDAVPFAPGELVERTALALVEAAAESAIWLDSRVDPAVPAQVTGDARRIGRVFEALAGHAVSHCEGGHIALSVAATAVRPDAVSLEFSVTTRGTTARRGWGGTDLRLTLVQRLVALIGGQLGREEAGDRADGGTRSWFTVDVAVAPATQAAPAAGTPESPAAREQRLQAWAERRGGRIMVVDDSATNRLVVAAVLGKAGFSVTLAEGGLEAVRAVRESRDPPELVLMDVSMPEMDGYAATAAIRALPGRRGRVPVLALTAHASADDRRRCLDAGMDDHVPKPVRKTDLLDTLSRWLP